MDRVLMVWEDAKEFGALTFGSQGDSHAFTFYSSERAAISAFVIFLHNHYGLVGVDRDCGDGKTNVTVQL